MLKFLYAIIIALFVTLPAAAQDDNYLRVYVGFSNMYTSGGTQRPGVEAAASYRVLEAGPIHLEATGSLGGNFNRRNNSLQAFLGPQVSADLFKGKMTVFGRQLFGTTYVNEQNFFTTSIGGGINVNFGNFFICPFQIDRQHIGRDRTIKLNKLGAGIGLQF